METGADQVQSLRNGLRDLVALTTLPAIWAGRQPTEIAESLADVLVRTVQLDLIYIRLNLDDPVLFELARSDRHVLNAETARQFGAAAAPLLALDRGGTVHPVDDPLNGGTLYAALFPVGHDGGFGFVAACARMPGFLSELRRLLLTTAVNQAAIALHQAQLLARLRVANQQKDSLLVKEQAARSEAEAANATQLKFLAMISHELRTPLTSIKGFASSILAQDIGMDDDVLHEFVTIIDEEADKLSGLVEDLLDLTRLHVGALSITPQPQQVTTILRMAQRGMATLSHAHQLVVVDPAALPLVLADSQRIAQVLVNLVGNAAKYAPLGTRITVSAHQQTDCVQFEIADEGEGIPLDDRVHVFEAFRQLERKQESAKGAGLGLAICKGLVEAHGGRIWIDESPTGGALVCFTLPVVQEVGVPCPPIS